ncbi:MAG: SRPBCC domain-containing protein [Solirubrobacterales bacterium]|nr:SRPBCC domain-containing protein [Solirubrobacterales bacterium]
MTVISATPDRDNLTLTVVAEFEATAERVWGVWEDPRKLEKWWGPPSWPASFTEFDFREGGEVKYHMTGPEGEKAPGYWRFKVIEKQRRLVFEDGFADDQGEPDDGLPAMQMTMTLEEDAGKTRMVTVTDFKSVEDLEKVLEMGMAEGMSLAMGQIDALL